VVAVALALAALIGLTLGALGSGGAILATPVLVYVAGISAHDAVVMTLAIVGITSLLGAYMHYRCRNYHLRATALLGMTGVAGAYLGSGGTRLVGERTLLLIFAAVMVIVGAAMLRSRPVGLGSDDCSPARCLSLGFGVGLLTGFLGIGGGFLIVPALTLLAGIDTKRAVGASLSIIAINSAAGLAGQLRYAELDWRTTLSFLAFTIAGMLLGVRLSGRMPERTLRTAFGLMTLCVGAVVTALNLR
jgi:uncharacterized membrane protein YfcA